MLRISKICFTFVKSIKKGQNSPIFTLEAMKDRIRQIMEAQHMSQQVFAQFIELSPASLSSIFNGRTKPTLNIVEAIKKKIPDINIDWLMFGSGPMYKSMSEGTDSFSQSQDQPTPSGVKNQNSVLAFDFDDSPAPVQSNPAPQKSNSVISTPQNQSRQEIKIVDKPPRRVTEIRVFYDDQTWESFVPAKK